MARLTEAQLVLETHLKELRFVDVQVEYRFARGLGREWRSDYYIPFYGAKPDVLIEIEGGVDVWNTGEKGRHTRGRGYEEDCLKYSTASALGYKLFRFSTGQVLNGTAKEFLRKWLT